MARKTTAGLGCAPRGSVHEEEAPGSSDVKTSSGAEVRPGHQEHTERDMRQDDKAVVAQKHGPAVPETSAIS